MGLTFSDHSMDIKPISNSVVLLLKDLIKTISFHWKSVYYFFQKFYCLCNSFFYSKLKKISMCEPLLFVKNDNCVDKEYEEANEQGFATRRWGCTLTHPQVPG